MTVFGPIPSRRLGRSLGINQFSRKKCSLSCIYCQVGHTPVCAINRRPYLDPDRLCDQVRERLAQLLQRGETVDFISFVPDGEPTLDTHLETAMVRLRELGIPLAVITNATFMDRPAVRAALQKADWVSLKVDAVWPDEWQAIDQPHPDLQLDGILNGMRTFAEAFHGTLTTETMLVQGVNDSPDHLTAVADFLQELRPIKAYIAVPTRPPAEADCVAPEASVIVHAYQLWSSRLPWVECLLGHETEGYTSSGHALQDILNITAVHPMRKQAAEALLDTANGDRQALETLIARGELMWVTHAEETFLVRPVRR